jgi:hypothetical protein
VFTVARGVLRGAGGMEAMIGLEPGTAILEIGTGTGEAPAMGQETKGAETGAGVGATEATGVWVPEEG